MAYIYVHACTGSVKVKYCKMQGAVRGGVTGLNYPLSFPM